MDITSLRAAQNDTSISPVGVRSGSGLSVIGNKENISSVDRAPSISPSISSGNRHIHGHGHHATNSSRFVEDGFQSYFVLFCKILQNLVESCRILQNLAESGRILQNLEES